MLKRRAVKQADAPAASLQSNQFREQTVWMRDGRAETHLEVSRFTVNNRLPFFEEYDLLRNGESIPFGAGHYHLPPRPYLDPSLIWTVKAQPQINLGSATGAETLCR
jgi:hypothetical protein